MSEEAGIVWEDGRETLHEFSKTKMRESFTRSININKVLRLSSTWSRTGDLSLYLNEMKSLLTYGSPWSFDHIGWFFK